jgi:membrane-associated protease RseP (regulator of RpoE activity)
VLEQKKVGDVAQVVTANGTFDVIVGTHPENASLPYLGVLVSQSQKTNPLFKEKYGNFTALAILWFMGLLYWIYLLSLGIGLFNLVPIGPIDGGQMSREIFRFLFKKEETALKVWGWTSLFFFALIMINLLSGFF